VLFLAVHIPDNKIAEIRGAVDIVDIISESVLLKKAGKNFLGLCPFHSEKTPSFTVSPDKQIYYCFGCGAGGNVFSFVMKRDGMAFGEAARSLARRGGVDLPEKPLSPVARKRAGEKEQLIAANRLALEFFRRSLQDRPEGKAARDYLLRRGLSQQTIEEFQIGYAPQGWDHLTRHLAAKRVPPPVIEKSGLAVPRKDGSGRYDRFRDRVMFPIFDEASRLVGFGGRVIAEGTPKYLNSPETPVYIKRRVLYGLDRAREACRSAGSVFIVEGYLDLIALHQGGIRNAVATLGTSLTVEHIRLLVRYARQLVLVYDSDEAGIRSAHRCVELFWKEHVDFSRGDVFREERADTLILVLPEGHDPDSFVTRHGADAFRKLAASAPGIITFLIESAVSRHGLSTEGKLHIISEVLPFLLNINDRIAQALYVQKLAERTGLPERVIQQRLVELDGKKRAGTPAASAPGRLETGSRTGPGEGRFEQRIVAMMLQFPAIIPDIASRDIFAYFETSPLRAVGELLIAHGYHSPDQLHELLAKIEDAAVRERVLGLAIGDEVWNLRGCRTLLNRFVENRQKQVGQAIDSALAEAEKADDEAEVVRLLSEKQKIAVRREKEKMAVLRTKR
jgi:DNA primase